MRCYDIHTRSTLFSQTTADGKRDCITAVMRRSSVHSKQRRALQHMRPQIRVSFLMTSHSWCEHVAEQLFQRIQGAKGGRSAVSHRRHDKHSASVFVQAARTWRAAPGDLFITETDAFTSAPEYHKMHQKQTSNGNSTLERPERVWIRCWYIEITRGRR